MNENGRKRTKTDENEQKTHKNGRKQTKMSEKKLTQTKMNKNERIFMNFSNIESAVWKTWTKILSINHLREELKLGPKSNMNFVSNMDGTYIY